MATPPWSSSATATGSPSRTARIEKRPRPPALVEILQEKEHGRHYDEQRYERVLRDSVADVVRQQADVGVDVVSDGEFGKSVSWSRYVRERIGGFELRPDEPGAYAVVAPGTDKRLFPEFYEEYESKQGFVGSWGNWVCVGPVKYVGQDAVRRDIDNLKAALEGVDVADGFLPVVALRDIVDLILKVPVGAYALEQGNPRHEHEWRVWEDVEVPQGRKLIPGVVSHVTNVVEHPELVAERLVRLAALVGRDNLMAGTDCGFAQGPFVQRVHPSVMWAKLRSLAEGAALASRRLWPG